MIGFGDHMTSNIVARIAHEEVAHVAVGLYWFLSVCQKMGRNPSSTFKGLRVFQLLGVSGLFLIFLFKLRALGQQHLYSTKSFKGKL